MNFRQIIQDYFTFSRNERKGIVVLLVLIFLLAVANKLLFYFETPAKIDEVLLDTASRKLGAVNDSLNQNESRKILFFFDPNTIDSGALDSLNVPESVKINLLKFRSKGGVIRSNSDFRKIYGVTDLLFDRVSPFLSIKSKTDLQLPTSSVSELFLFDPNNTSDRDFLRLGFSGKQITIFRKYLDKGGVFRNKADFFKIRVISEDQKNVLDEWVAIEPIEKVPSVDNLKIETSSFELNSADSIQLKQLPGIGNVLSKRIVKYRDLLGGFYSVSQLKEVYGLSEETISLIKDKVTVDISRIRKLDLNFTDVNELSRHPYLPKNLARQIVKFRTKNGSIQKLITLRDSMILNMEEFNRILPYF